MNIAQKGLVFIIRIYQLTLSPLLAAAFGASGHCRFTPSCSQYAREAVRLLRRGAGRFAGRTDRLCITASPSLGRFRGGFSAATGESFRVW